MEKILCFFRNKIDFLRDDRVEIRIRMLYLLEYAVIVACLIGSCFWPSFPICSCWLSARWGCISATGGSTIWWPSF